MLTNLSNTLRKYANGWLVLVFLAGEVFFNAVLLPAQSAKIAAGSGGLGPIDLQLFYTPDKVYGMIDAYGEEVRASYRLFEMTGDIPAEETELNRWFGSLSGLTWAGRRAAREVHEFLGEASDRHRIPSTYAQLERDDDGECDCDVEETRPRRRTASR